MKIEFTNEEIWEAWNEIIKYSTQCTEAGYPDGAVVLIRKVLEKN